MAGPVLATPAHWTPCAGSPHAQTLRCNKRTTGVDRLHTVQCVVHHTCMSQGKASAPHQRVTRDHMQISSRTAITQHGCTLTTPLQRMLVWAVCRKHAQIIKPVLEISACWTLCAGKPHCRAASMTDSIWLSHDTIGISTGKLQLVRHTPC